MSVLKFFIKGYDPVAEVTEACKHYGAYVGQPVMVKGIQGHVWHYIFQGRSARKPLPIEYYLFSGEEFNLTK